MSEYYIYESRGDIEIATVAADMVNRLSPDGFGYEVLTEMPPEVESAPMLATIAISGTEPGRTIFVGGSRDGGVPVRMTTDLSGIRAHVDALNYLMGRMDITEVGGPRDMVNGGNSIVFINPRQSQPAR